MSIIDYYIHNHVFFLTSPMVNVLGIIAIVSEGLNQIGYQKNMIIFL